MPIAMNGLSFYVSLRSRIGPERFGVTMTRYALNAVARGCIEFLLLWFLLALAVHILWPLDTPGYKSLSDRRGVTVIVVSALIASRRLWLTGRKGSNEPTAPNAGSSSE